MGSVYIPDFSEMLAVSHSRGADSEAPELWDDLVGLWPMAEAGGLTASDLSGNGNHGTLTRMDPATDWVPSPYGWALDFPTTAEEVSVPSSPLFALDDFSVVLWARRDGWFNPYVRFFQITSFTLGCSITRNASSDGIQLWVNGTAVATTVAFPDLTWTCLVVTRQGTTGRIYYNGEDVTTTFTCGSGTLTAGELLIGRGTSGTAFRGQIANTILYRKELTPSKIQELYNKPLALLELRSQITFGEVEVEPEPPEVFLHDGRHNRIASIMSRMQATQRFRRIVRMPLDLSGDFAVIDGKVSIILAGDVINDVVMLQSKQREGDPSEGAYLHRETTFQVPTTGDLDPKVGDTVAVSGVSYRILDVREPFLGDYWGLKTRELSITADTDLQDLITLFPAVHTTDDYGSKRTTHPTASDTFASVPGKVQPKPATTEELAAKRGFKKTYWIYVSAELPTLKRGDLVKDQNSKQYTIESWTNRQRIDELSVIVCSTPPGS